MKIKAIVPDAEKQQAIALLTELDTIKGGDQLRRSNWIARAQTFLIFAAIKCLGDNK